MTKFQSVFFRFLKAFVSGALATVTLSTIVAPKTWTELNEVLGMLALSAVWGGIVAVIMAGQKWYSWKN